MISPATLLALCALTFAAPAGVEEALVSSSLGAGGPFAVGERITLHVDLKVPRPFSGVARFELPELSGCLLVKSAERTVVGSETISGTSYFTQRHELLLYPQRAGEVVVPAFGIDFRSKDFLAKEPIAHRVLTSELRVEVTQPPGAEGTRVATTALTLEESWESEPGETAELGAAFVRSVTLTAEGVPSILLPELGIDRAGELRAYGEEPRLDEKTERGEFTSTRVEAVTYVCESAGDFELPAVELAWWDLSADRKRVASLPARKLTVLAAADDEPVALLKTNAGKPRDYAYLAVFAALLLGLATWRRHELSAWWTRRRELRRTSEDGRWRTLLATAKREEATPTLNALYDWMSVARAELVTLEELCELLETPLERELSALQRAAIDHSASWNPAALIEQLRSARSELKRLQSGSHHDALQLNP
jgi:hypothetical protein